jgi:signal transduction histidine kinase
MEKYFSLIRIGQKLRAIIRFSGSSEIFFRYGELLYGYQHGPDGTLNEVIEYGDESTLRGILESYGDIKAVTIAGGKLIFIEPSGSVEENTLSFLAKELEEDLQFASIVDTLFQASVTISSNLKTKTLLDKVMSLSEGILNPEVTAVMLLDPEREELYWEVSRGEGSQFFQEEVRLPLGSGIGGHVAQTGEPLIINDVNKDPRWDPSYDNRSGFRTHSMICVPIKFKGRILGVIEVINKRTGEFTSRDLRILEILAAQTGGAIENARIHEELEETYQELKVLDKAKERVINHLSHELKTPLAMIAGVLAKVSNELQKANLSGLDKTIKRGQRNLERLLELQFKIDDILNQRSVDEKERIINIISDAADFVEELGEEDHEKGSEILELISNRLESLFTLKEVRMEDIKVDELLDDVCNEAVLSMGGRNLEIVRDLEKGIVLNMDVNTLKKVFRGLLKNAIENTPDEGRIEISAGRSDNEVQIGFRDYGIGITAENQKMIFGGFFHTQDTNLYSSKRPYEFNAGGSGADLLRIKTFSERYGFSVDFNSMRCKFIPKDSDICTGIISECRFIKERSDCLASGGSVFSVKFPLESPRRADAN